MSRQMKKVFQKTKAPSRHSKDFSVESTDIEREVVSAVPTEMEDSATTHSPINMKDTAINRAPIEVWMCILELAISTPMHHYDNDNIAQDLLLFDTSCQSAGMFIKSERIRTTLRLVCKSWNRLLKNWGDQLRMTEILGEYWPSKEVCRIARRMEFIIQFETRCYCPKMQCPRSKCILREPPAELRDEGSAEETFEQLEALVLHRASGVKYVPPRHAPELRLLSWQLNFANAITEFQDYDVFKNLTHLYLYGVQHGILRIIGRDLQLPEVTMLSLHLTRHGQWAGNLPELVGKPNIPKLKRLAIGGECGRDTWKDIEMLTSACSRTIRELVCTLRMRMDITISSVAWSTIEGVLNSLPHLTVYGTNDFYLPRNLPRSSSSQQPWALLLIDTVSVFVDQKMEDVKKATDTLGIRRILVDQSWRELQIVKGLSKFGLGTTVSALKDMIQEGITVCDLDGFLLTEPSGRLFIEVLEAQSVGK